jgi:hypothetical protein
MVNIAHIDVLSAGDIGGAGISRVWFQRSDASSPVVSDCNAAAAAVRALWGAASTYLSDDMTYTISPTVELLAHDTGEIQGLVTLSSVPSPVTGGSSSNYAAGTGFRLNWKTQSIHNRRFIRGCNFLTPVGSGGWSTSGQVASGAQSGMASAIATYLAAMATASLDPIVWHRPPKGTFSGGAVGLVLTGILSPTPASLRSRRS